MRQADFLHSKAFNTVNAPGLNTFFATEHKKKNHTICFPPIAHPNN